MSCGAFDLVHRVLLLAASASPRCGCSRSKKASKLRKRAGKSCGLAVDDDRDLLLGETAMRAQRLLESGEIMPVRGWCRSPWSRAGPPETTTRSPMRSSRQFEARAGLARGRAPRRCRAALADERPIASASGPSTIDRREGSERAVMHDIGIGDRQDDLRLAGAKAARPSTSCR